MTDTDDWQGAFKSCELPNGTKESFVAMLDEEKKIVVKEDEVNFMHYCMKKLLTAFLLFCVNCNVFAQGYALDEVYKESSSRDSDFNPFYAFIGILMIIGVYYVLKSMFSSFRNSSADNSTKKLPPQTIKEPTNEEIAKSAMREFSRRMEYAKQKEDAERDWKTIQTEALQILKTEFQTPYIFDNVSFTFKAEDLAQSTIDAFTKGYYWGLIRRFQYTPKEQFDKTYHIIVRLGYDRGLKEPQRHVAYCGEFMPRD